MKRLIGLVATSVLLAACAPAVVHAPAIGPARPIPAFVPSVLLVPLVTIDEGCYPPNQNQGGQWAVTYRYPGWYRFDGKYFQKPLPWHVAGDSEATRSETFGQGSVLPWWVEYKVSAPGTAYDGRIYRVSEISGLHFLAQRCGQPV